MKKQRKYLVVKKAMLCVAFLGLQLAFAESTRELQRAQEYLDSRGEVEFNFYPLAKDQVDKLSKIISIEYGDGKSYFAFANKEQFAEFLTYGIAYEVQTPEWLLAPEPEMSAYEDFSPLLSEIKKYPTYEGYEKIMKECETQNPQLVSIVETGKSVQGRKILFAKVTSNVNTPNGKPRVILTSGIHGPELGGYAMFLRLIQYLSANYQRDALVTKIVDNVEVWINPLHNPDGTYKGGNSTVKGATRQNAHGKDLNRNYPDVSQPNPKMEPEVQAVHDLELKERPILGLDTHGNMNAYAIPFSYQDGPVIPDRKLFDYLCTNILGGPITKIIAPSIDGPYAAAGTRFDWAYYGYGGRMPCVEFPTGTLPESQFESYWTTYSPGIIRFIAEAVNGVTGKVYDAKSGNALSAKVELKEIDGEYGRVFTNKTFGTFSHPAHPGTYTVVVTPDNSAYTPKTFASVSVESGKPTVIDAALTSK